MTAFQFDATQVEPSTGSGSQLPIGRHKVVIIADEAKQVKDDPQSGYLQLMLQCIEGPAQGVTMGYNLNIYNQSETAKRIAYQQLSAICHVVSVYKIDDTQQLYNKPFLVEVTQQPNNEKYHQISAVMDVNGNKPGQQSQGAAQQAAPANQQAATAPQGGAWGAPAGQTGQGSAPAAQTAWGAPSGGAAPAGGETPPWKR